MGFSIVPKDSFGAGEHSGLAGGNEYPSIAQINKKGGRKGFAREGGGYRAGL
jgi:hypothetical protein